MKLTNAAINNHINSLSKISDKVTGKLAYAVARNIRKLSEENIDFEQSKDALIKKHGEEKEDGLYHLSPASDNYISFMNELRPIAEIEHEIDIFQIPEEELMDTALNAKEILAIGFMIQ